VNDRLRGIVQAATGIVDAIGSIPAPVLGLGTQLAGIVAAIALVGGAALIAVPKVAQFRASLATLNISAGAAARGIAVASTALAIAGTAFAVWAQRQAEATATTAEFLESLDKSTGAVTDYTRELVTKKLAEADAFDGAKAAGISQRELTDAILAGGDAVEELRQRLYDYANANPFDANIANSVNAVNRLSDGLESSAEDFEDHAAAADESAEKSTDAATAYNEAADKAAELQSNLQSLIETVNKANGVGQDAITANIAYRDALADVDEIIASGEGTRDDHLSSLVDLAAKSQEAAEAQYELDQNTDAYLAALRSGRQALLDRAADLGLTAEEAENLANQIFRIPSKKEVEILAETADAQSDVDDWIARNAGRRFSVYVDAIGGAGGGGRGMLQQADGGHVKFYANGGRERHDAQYARAGTWRVWAEPETGGEWYLPDSPAKRDRSVALAQQMLAGWGYQMVPAGFRNFADGGELRYAPSAPVFMSGSGSGGAPVINVDVHPGSGLNEEMVGRIAAEKTAFQLRRS
jgi:hypothetical protein